MARGDISPEEAVRMQRDSDLVRDEFSSPNYGNIFGGVVPFDTRILDDERILAFFDPDKTEYRNCYAPLAPFSSRLLSTVSLTEREVRIVADDIDIASEECHCLADTAFEHYMIDSLATSLKWRVTGAARLGFLLKTITENRKTLRLYNEQEKRKKFLGIL